MAQHESTLTRRDAEKTLTAGALMKYIEMSLLSTLTLSGNARAAEVAGGFETLIHHSIEAGGLPAPCLDELYEIVGFLGIEE